MATIEQIRKVHEAEPFRPFNMHLADGRRIPVPRREFLAISPSGRTVAVFLPDESFEIVDLFLVTDLEFNRGSGPRKKRGPPRS
jgi:hypothetical protein